MDFVPLVLVIPTDAQVERKLFSDLPGILKK